MGLFLLRAPAVVETPIASVLARSAKLACSWYHRATITHRKSGQVLSLMDG